jgi:hypothetical protein
VTSRKGGVTGHGGVVNGHGEFYREWGQRAW